MRRRRNRILQIASVAVALAAWEIVGLLGVSSALPPFHSVAAALRNLVTDERFRDGAVSTATAIVIAFPPTVVVGIVLGSAMAVLRPVRWSLDPYLTLGLSLPLVSVIPVIISIFGLGRPTIMAVIVVYTLPVLILNTAAGFGGVDPEQVAMAHSFEARWPLLLRRVMLPAAAPLVVAGIRLAAGRAVKGAIIAEQIVGLIGLGGIIQRYGGAFAVEELYAAILFVGVGGVAVVFLIGRLERRVVV